MQTFLPYPTYTRSICCLDYKRLGKQRVEAKQIWDALQPGSTSRWQNHPAVKMWRGYEDSLSVYHDLAIAAWILRGYKNTMSYLRRSFIIAKTPPWLGKEEFHASHRSNLLRKDPDYYGQFGWTEPNNLPYIWPV